MDWQVDFFLPLSHQGSPLHTVEIGKTGEKSSPSSLLSSLSLVPLLADPKRQQGLPWWLSGKEYAWPMQETQV